MMRWDVRNDLQKSNQLLRIKSEIDPDLDVYAEARPYFLELLRKRHPSTHLVLEIHEAAVADVATLRELRIRLDALGVGLAFDDFGRGQSRLMELGDVAPRYVKFDADMIQNLHLPSEKKRRRAVRELVEQSRKMDVITIAECIETAEEAAACVEVGFEIGQGQFFGYPAPAAHW